MTAQISTIAILTCDRLPGLVRALESYIVNVKKYGRQVEFAIFDDSRDPAAREATRTKLHELKQKHAVTIRYAGREEKQAYADALQKESGVDRRLIDFALFDPFEIGYSVGANRNSTLLHTAGEMFYSADDDTVCEFFAMANYRPGFAITSLPNPTELYFFRDIPSAQGTAFRTEKDLLEIVGDLLGQVPKELLERSKAAADTKTAQPGYAQAMQHEPWRVRVSWVGIFGDSGYVYPSFLLWLQGESRRRLLRDADFYAAIKQSRQILRAPLKRTLGPGPFCQTTALGIDNRDLLPPFLPIFRGEDFAFGNLLRKCWSGAVFGYLPWGIRHDPFTPRHNKPDDILIPAGYTNFFPLLGSLLEGYNPVPDKADEARLADCGRYILDLARDSTSFSQLVRNTINGQKIKSIEMHQKILDTFQGQPEYWAQDVRDFSAAVESAAKSEAYYIPKEVRGERRDLALCQDIIQALGRLIETWPTIHEGAKALNLAGRRLAQLI